MKRTLLTILAIFHLGISQGATVYFHYCMGELVQLDLNTPKQNSCDYCGMSKKERKKDSCCKDEVKQAKVDNSKKTGLAQFQFQQTSFAVLKNDVLEPRDIAVSEESGNVIWSNAPPKGMQIPVFILHCTYRI
ncbi:hypothetical protein AAKU52_002713 [Pedobacter sp. CG_S7]|uniref:HYC_CC_PP family protein n=1 Tax=Pedobacter sp. CG_S7 TaxID=3143930 RepID=UPI00339618BE